MNITQSILIEVTNAEILASVTVSIYTHNYKSLLLYFTLTSFKLNYSSSGSIHLYQVYIYIKLTTIMHFYKSV
jgi:hypothetical protein